ncbi:hypothetical protein [Conexibacter sp. CPCC 206217]|uniref:hypothetical protein n=1 Tax=Conexibacter sp. CPCC 206217 TaxID=3064574 RepID=UPI0027201422|nr:hypothetical protein [Conexibacter sp. CPCC 206217]MDO8213717.1 hypothetical protein [Conexibacter sp. CPCC 206217]
MFRRKQDEEDPFAALKDAAERGSPTIASAKASTSSGNVGASASVGGDRGDHGAPQVDGVPGAPRGRRGSNALLVFLTIVLALGGAGALVYFSEADTPTGAHDGGSFSESGSGSDAGDSPSGDGQGSSDEQGDDGTPRPTRRYDLMRPATFKQALNGIQKKLKPGERVWLLRLAPDRINSSTRLRNGDQRLIDVDDELNVGVQQAGSAGERIGLRLSQVDPQAPSRAVRKAAAQGRFPARKLDYLVLMSPFSPGDQPDWSLFFRDVSARNSHWKANFGGRTVYRPGEQPGQTSASRDDSVTIRTDSGTQTLTGAEARRVMTCVRNAQGNGGDIQRCLP